MFNVVGVHNHEPEAENYLNSTAHDKITDKYDINDP